MIQKRKYKPKSVEVFVNIRLSLRRAPMKLLKKFERKLLWVAQQRKATILPKRHVVAS